jgi:hypothetical protein
MLWLLTLLFVLLSPGVLLTLPPGRRGVFMSGQTSMAAVLVHALVFFLVATYVLPIVRSALEGFTDNMGTQENDTPCTDGHECKSGNCVNGLCAERS